MDASVSLPDPGEFNRPLQNGHAPGLVSDEPRPFAPAAFDAADVSDMLAAPGFELTADVVEEQVRALEEEFRAELDLLPGFETLTYADLTACRNDPRPCPDWCASADLPGHGDGFDTTPETEVPHRGVEHDIPVRHGGQSLDHAGRAEVSAQLEQDRDLATGPVIALSVVVRGIEQYAWLTPAEGKALYRNLGQILDDATGHR